jgi:hypothetical protein
VNVVHSVDGKSFAFQFSGDTTQVSMEIGLQIGNNQAKAIFSAEDDVRKKVSECSTHAKPYAARAGAQVLR